MAEGLMTEKRFWAKKEEDEEDEDDDYDYPRPVLRIGTVEEHMNLPYRRIPLFRQTSDKKVLSTFKIGKKTEGVLKVAINIQINKPEEDDEEEEEKSSEPVQEETTKTSKHGEGKEFDVGKIPIPMDFFNPDIKTKNCPLWGLFKFKHYKARVYILRMINLSAVDSKPDLPAIASGYQAMSSVDAYPEIYVGDLSRAKSGKNKYINE
jgi:hypothetical protein